MHALDLCIFIPFSSLFAKNVLRGSDATSRIISVFYFHELS